jgi:hypothetical protein
MNRLGAANAAGLDPANFLRLTHPKSGDALFLKR